MRVEEFSAFDLVDQPIFVLAPDADNRPVYAFLNAAALGRLGKTLDEVAGLPAYQVFSGRAAYSVYRHQCLVWSNGQAAEYEIALPVGASETMWARTKVKPVFDEAGALTHMIGISLDITPERDQLQVHTMAAAAAREVEDLVCLAAHDLRTPIGNLKSLAYLMRQDFVDHGDGKIHLIDMIDEISDKALSVVSDIMGQAMATSTRTEQEGFDIGAVCDDIMVLLDPTRTHSVAYPRRIIEAEFMVVHIILRNLIDNALKHSGQQAAQVMIELTPMNAERLLFIVRDNGCGFDASTFQDQDAASDTTIRGFGLIGVRRLVRSRGGQITVSPPVSGQGAEIRVELPGRLSDISAASDYPLQIA